MILAFPVQNLQPSTAVDDAERVGDADLVQHRVPGGAVGTTAASSLLPYGLVLSLMLHIGLAVLAVWQLRDERIGSGGSDVEAIGVEIVSSNSLEAITIASEPTSSATVAPAEPSAPTTATPAPAELSAQPAVAPPPQPTAEALVIADQHAPDDADLTGAPLIRETLRAGAPEQVERRQDEVVREAKTTPKAVTEKEPGQHPERHPAIDGATGSASPAEAPPQIAAALSRSAPEQTKAASVPAAATAGAAARYAVEVRMVLGRHRPRQRPGRGRVTLSFAIETDGRVTRVEVAKSSGNSSVDDAALAAVRAARFPKPPAGLTDKQRHFIAPFAFR